MSEIDELSDFVFFASDIVEELKISEAYDKFIELLNKTTNQTLILRCLEVLNAIDKLNTVNKDDVLKKISDSNIKAVIEQLFI